MSVSQKQKVEVEVEGSVNVETEQTSHHAVGPIEDSAPEVPVVEGDKVVERINEHRDAVSQGSLLSADSETRREVFVLVGLAGAGKSTVADIIEETHDERVATFEVSDFVRHLFEEAHDEEVNLDAESADSGANSTDESAESVSDNELGAWAAERKEEEGQDYFVRKMAQTIKSPSTPHVVISGVRSPEEAVAVEDVFGHCTTVGIWTLPDIRFERKYGGSPSTEHDEWSTFTDRNERELWDWGAVEFFSRDSVREADAIIPNHDDLDTLRTHVETFLEGRGQYDENPFPHSDFEKVAQYL